jgi:multiple sugar transport system substrate-binding protein
MFADKQVSSGPTAAPKEAEPGMAETVVLRGMTWDHPRGYDPLAACSALWRERTGVAVEWDRRSLQDFESYPVEELARRYDLIVIDHPHVGQVTAETCLRPLDEPQRATELEALRAGSVGASFESYRMGGRLWALPIDAATQVQAFRPDRLASPLRAWSEVVRLAHEGRVLCPMRPPHSLMSLYTLAGQLGAPAKVEGPDLFDLERVAPAYELLRELAGLIDPVCFAMDPIAVFERMAQAESKIDCAPLIYGYVSYALEGFRPARIAFADLAAAGGLGPAGSALGGAGVAVSAFSVHREAAADFAFWVASGEVQRGPYAAAGGQPGHAAAWEDEAVNAPVFDFYRATRATLEGTWVRPRHNGYMPFQHTASERLNAGLAAGEGAAAVLAELNRLFRESLPR